LPTRAAVPGEPHQWLIAASCCLCCRHSAPLAQNPLIYTVVRKKILSSADDGGGWQECITLPGHPIIQALTTATDSTGAEGDLFRRGSSSRRRHLLRGADALFG